MDPQHQFCRNRACRAYGREGEGHVVIHSRAERRYRCKRCRRTFAETGYVLGPIVLGLIADFYGANAALSSATALLVVSGLLFAMLAPEKRRRRSPAL